MSRWNPLIVQIDEKLRGLPSNHSTCSIFKVPSRLRHVNERAFEPEILSIGPYHRGKDNLKMMEEHKKRYLQELLQLPFFVLRELFNKMYEDQNEDFFGMALNFCQRIFPGSGNRRIPENVCKHLLDIMYRTGYQQPITRAPQDNDRYFIRNAKELQEAGIKFKKREGSGRLFDVVFLENGTIKTDFFFF